MNETDIKDLNNADDESKMEASFDEEERSVSGVSVELSQAGKKRQRENPVGSIPKPVINTTQDNRTNYGVPAYTGAYQTPYGTYVNPKDEYEKHLEMKKHRSLAIASLVLGGLSLGFFWMYGLGIIPAVIGVVFGFISFKWGTYTTKTMGLVGLILCMVGLVLNAVTIFAIASIINWDNVTIYNINKGREIDPSDTDAMWNWLQLFLKTDISGYI